MGSTWEGNDLITTSNFLGVPFKKIPISEITTDVIALSPIIITRITIHINCKDYDLANRGLIIVNYLFKDMKINI
jgi:hypothetical protein